MTEATFAVRETETDHDTSIRLVPKFQPSDLSLLLDPCSNLTPT